jgi:hypothetical protein
MSLLMMVAAMVVMSNFYHASDLMGERPKTVEWRLGGFSQSSSR